MKSCRICLQCKLSWVQWKFKLQVRIYLHNQLQRRYSQLLLLGLEMMKDYLENYVKAWLFLSLVHSCSQKQESYADSLACKGSSTFVSYRSNASFKDLALITQFFTESMNLRNHLLPKSAKNFINNKITFIFLVQTLSPSIDIGFLL